MRARSSVPPPGGLSQLERAVQRADAVAEAADPAPAAVRLRAADAVVGHLDREDSWSTAAMRTRASTARACLTVFVSASETKK